MLCSQALCGRHIGICEDVKRRWRTEYLGVGEIGEDRFMNARGPHKFMADKIHYCTYVQDQYVTETGGEERGSKDERGWEEKGK